MNEAILLENRYPATRCAVCRGLIPRGEIIVYRGDLPRGQKVKHPDCVGLTPELAATRAAVEAAKEADLAARKEEAALVAAQAATRREEAAVMVIRWLNDQLPQMPRLRQRLLARITEIEAPPEGAWPHLRVLPGGRCS